MHLSAARRSRALVLSSICAASLVLGAAVEQPASGRPQQVRILDVASVPLIVPVAEPNGIDLARHASALGVAGAHNEALRALYQRAAALAAAKAKARAVAKAKAAAAANANKNSNSGRSNNTYSNNTYSNNSVPITTTPSHTAPPAPKKATPPKPAPPSGSSQSGSAYSVLSALNSERAAHGAAALSMSGALVSSAHQHNLAMAAANTMSHQEPGEAVFSTRISNAGYDWNACAENIGWTTDMSTAGALSLESEMYAEGPGGGHYDNIVNKAYRNVGIDVYFDTVHHKLWLTEDFGDPA